MLCRILNLEVAFFSEHFPTHFPFTRNFVGRIWDSGTIWEPFPNYLGQTADHQPRPRPAPKPLQQPAHHTCCTLQRLHLTLQCAMACPRLAIHTLAECCALCVLCSVSSSTTEKLRKVVKPQPPHNHLPSSAAAPAAASATPTAHCTGCI